MQPASSAREAAAETRSKLGPWVERAGDRAYIADMNSHFDSGMPQSDPLAAALARKSVAGAPGAFHDTALGAGDGWRVYDIVCTCGPLVSRMRNVRGETKSIENGSVGLAAYSFSGNSLGLAGVSSARSLSKAWRT